MKPQNLHSAFPALVLSLAFIPAEIPASGHALAGRSAAGIHKP